MGIGISYTGANGATQQFELDGVPKPGTRAASLLSMQPIQMPNFIGGGSYAPLIDAPSFFKDDGGTDSGKVSVAVGDPADYLGNKLASNGSIEVVGNRLQLKGDDTIKCDNAVYAVSGGRRGFCTLGDIDPPTGGTSLVASGDSPDGSSVSLHGNGGATVTLGCRLDAKVDITDKDCDRIVVKEFSRLGGVTPNGRVHSITGERERILLDYTVVPCRYATMVAYEYDATDTYKEHPKTIKWIAFGKESDLATYIGEEQDETGVWWGHFQANEDVKDGKTEANECPVKITHFGGSTLSVRAFWDDDKVMKPTLQKLAFGPESDLASWDGESTSDTIKVVGVSACTHGIRE